MLIQLGPKVGKKRLPTYLCAHMVPRLILYCTLFSLLCGCAPDQSGDVNVRLTLSERERLDKMVLAHMDSIRPILEAQCERTQADRVAVATDSIVQRALEQEARLRARIQSPR